MTNHSASCHCQTCTEPISEKEKEYHVALSESSRREFLKKASRLSLALGGGLVSPIAASALAFEDGAGKSKEMFANNAVKNGKAEMISILHTADIHAQLFTHDEFFVENEKVVFKKRGGYATLKTMIDQLRKQNPANTFLVDGGDCLQGSGTAALSKGSAIVPLMNKMNYDLMLPGNWEVVYGKEMLLKDMFGCNSPKVCANMYHQSTDALDAKLIFPPYYVKKFGAIKIGFLGYNDPTTPRRQSPAYSKGMRFSLPEENMAKYIKILREQEGCAIVLLVTHLGLAQQVAIANQPEANGVDYILGADTHERVRTPIEGKFAKVVEPGAFGSFVGKLDFVVEDGIIKDQSYQLLDVDPDRYHEDEEMKNLVKKVREPYQAQLDRVIGTTKTPLLRYYILETPMDNFITDAIMWKFNPDIALSNGFRFCPPLVPNEKTGVAEITEDFLWSMLPVESDAKEATVTGQQLWEWLEKELTHALSKKAIDRFGGWVVRFKGMEVNFTMAREEGKRLNWIKIKGEAIDLNKTYRVVACERQGDPDTTLCRFDGVNAPTKLNATVHSVVREYLAQHSPIAPTLEGRMTATDAPQTLLTQMLWNGYEFR